MKITTLATILTIALTAGVSVNANASLAHNAILLMGPQTTFCESGLGVPGACVIDEVPATNYWAMDQDGSGTFDNIEREGIEPGTDGGITLGLAQGYGEIDTPWVFFNQTGYHHQPGTVSVASDDGAGNVTLNMSGWSVNWNSQDVNLGEGAPAIISCGNTCEIGDSFFLDYTAIVPDGVFMGVSYQLHLEGVIATPVPAAVWLFGSGLIGLIGVARRKKA